MTAQDNARKAEPFAPPFSVVALPVTLTNFIDYVVMSASGKIVARLRYPDEAQWLCDRLNTPSAPSSAGERDKDAQNIFEASFMRLGYNLMNSGKYIGKWFETYDAPETRHAANGWVAATLSRAAMGGAPNIDEIMSQVYLRFKVWSKRQFSADDVTWCEVRADILAIIRQCSAAMGEARKGLGEVAEIAKTTGASKAECLDRLSSIATIAKETGQ